MNNNKNYFELIDSYLNGQMNSGEAIDFEGQLLKDPLLENEFQVQKEIIESIKNYRSGELKATLNAVEVGGGAATGFNIAAGVILALLLGSGIYYFTGSTDTTEDDSKVIADSEPISTPKQIKDIDALPDNNVVKESIKDADVTAEQVIEQVEAEDQSPETGKQSEINLEVENESIAELSEKEQPVIHLPEIVEEFDNQEESKIAENISIPQNNLSKVSETILPGTEVVEVNKGKYSFHYQFFNNKLFLYGEFDDEYEILELNTPTGISIYMFYQDNFYELTQNQKKITPLESIQDNTLIEDLNTIKAN